MKRTIVCLLTILLTSCATFRDRTLSQIKDDLDCIEYKEGISWAQISGKFSTPDIAPLPEPGTDLSRNARGYKNKIIIFYTEIKEVKEGEKVRFHEVVTNVEVCNEE